MVQVVGAAVMEVTRTNAGEQETSVATKAVEKDGRLNELESKYGNYIHQTLYFYLTLKTIFVL